MASGVTVSSNAKATYEELKNDKRYRYIIYYIKDNKVIEVESTGPRDATYENFLEELNKYESDCRYCVFDFPVNVPVKKSQETSSMSVNRLVLMRWCPESAHIKKKMSYFSSFEALKRSLVGIDRYIEASELDEASQEAVEERCI